MDNNHFKGLPIQGNVIDFNTRYLNKIIDTINRVCDEHKRVYAVRVDLRLPQAPEELDCLSRDEVIGYHRNRDKLMSRFIESLKAKIKARDAQSRRVGKRTHHTCVRYTWCRERDTSINDHYHVTLLFNKDRFYRLGDYTSRSSLSGLIVEAWASALALEFEFANGLIHFPSNCSYYLADDKPEFNQQYADLFYRVSYLAKKETKHYGEGHRNFGCSQR